MDPSFSYIPVNENEIFSNKTKNMSNNFSHIQDGPRTQTLQPMVTGTSVLGIKYADGVMLSADTLASYGSMARFITPRLHKINKNTLIGVSGEVSDMQQILKILEDFTTEEFCLDDGHEASASEIYSYLSRILYSRRSKFNPLWNHIIVAGFDNEDQPFLGSVDLYGCSFADDTLATGYGDYIARPLLRNHQKNTMSEEDASALLERSMTVLFYRDARALDLIQIGKITKAGVEISEPFRVKTNWDIGKRD